MLLEIPEETVTLEAVRKPSAFYRFFSAFSASGEIGNHFSVKKDSAGRIGIKGGGVGWGMDVTAFTGWNKE